jgi:hypothetical protein
METKYHQEILTNIVCKDKIKKLVTRIENT